MIFAIKNVPLITSSYSTLQNFRWRHSNFWPFKWKGGYVWEHKILLESLEIWNVIIWSRINQIEFCSDDFHVEREKWAPPPQISYIWVKFSNFDADAWTLNFILDKNDLNTIIHILKSFDWKSSPQMARNHYLVHYHWVNYLWMDQNQKGAPRSPFPNFFVINFCD